MDEYATPIPPVGEISIVRERLHGTALNTMVVPHSAPQNWFFKQFPSRDALEGWALDNHFTIKDGKGNDNNDDN